MLTYCILRKTNHSAEIEVVETGFSVLAFIFGPIWAIFKSLWLYSFLGILFLLLFSVLLESKDLSFFFSVVSLTSSVFWGFFARDLYIQFLINKKFRPIKHINANSKEKAIIKYLSEER